MTAYESAPRLSLLTLAQARRRGAWGLRAALAVLAIVGCKQPAPAEQHATDAVVEPQAQHFGQAFQGAGAVSLATLLDNPDRFENQLLATQGEVKRACSRKGCWMELADGDARCRVTFKDYGFFVPTDSAGARATLEGQIELKRLPATRVRHLEAEGATFAHKKADGSAFETKLVATAVQLVRSRE